MGWFTPTPGRVPDIPGDDGGEMTAKHDGRCFGNGVVKAMQCRWCRRPLGGRARRAGTYIECLYCDAPGNAADDPFKGLTPA